MQIQDPRQTTKIDVTGWDLDHLAEIIATVRADALVGSLRELTDEEAIALASPEIEGLLPAESALTGWAVGDKEVIMASERLGEIVDEALYQRDLPRALAKLNGTAPGELTSREREAYGALVDGVSFEDFALYAH